ncbi:unnamed protein product [Mycena citricolor]|uniref:DNA mismatch repair proteins mutS family domain-containing protein n=1 Tax=Mycena citricolor TaxID=2018698 RepID=A0AAD2HQT7_9AGAR|nr:unnamed protein product [Mycena citricolor]
MRPANYARQVARAFVNHSSTRAFQTRAPLRATTRAKKSYAELPDAHLLPDGTVAVPLDEWWSGTSPREGRESLHLNETKPEAGPSSLDAHPPSSSPVKRRKKVENESPDTSAPKRTRKKIAGPVNDDACSQPTEKHAISNSTQPESTPSGRRKMKTSTEGNDSVDPSEPPVRRKRKKVSEDEPDPEIVSKVSLPREVLDNLDRFPHCILLTRVGKFYESYFDQAYEVSKSLNIKLAFRKWGGGQIPFCGFPLLHLDKYLKVLVQQQRKFVALCEEFPRYGAQGTVTFDRRVARVVTPGTLIDESFLNQYENNFLLAVGTADERVGLAWIDVSTGEFYSKSVDINNLRDEASRIGPREIVLNRSLEPSRLATIRALLSEEECCVSLRDVGTTAVPNGYDLEQTPVDDVISSEEQHLLDHMPQLAMPARENSAARMQIDSHTVRALEIRESIREGGVTGSLISTVKRTVTGSGTRLLMRWLCSPSTSLSEINARQALVAFFHQRDHFRADLTAALASSEDAGRIVQRFLLGRGDANDLHAVNSTIGVWRNLASRIMQERDQEMAETARQSMEFKADEWASMDALIGRLCDLSELSARITSALKPKEPGNQSGGQHAFEGDDAEVPESDVTKPAWKFGATGWTIRPEFSEKLLSLHTTLEDLLNQRERLQADLQLTYDAPSLTLRSSPAHGMHVHLLKAKRDRTKIGQDPDFVGIAESGSTKCYFYPKWAQLGGQIVETTNALLVAEKEAFESLRAEVNSHTAQLRRNARVLDELDVTLAFASLAKEMNFVRPDLSAEPEYTVVNGRHPTVELGLLTSGRVFTPNSVELTSTSRLHIITGPNMAGKSTLLRQTALIAILAQTGSFVPADAATVGIVDKLFSRVGAKDDLFHDRSTFMVEMLETAEILSRATPQSLVIMDEVGRGTTVTDGLAIAFATVHHLLKTNQCRALFATHFHELADMLGYASADPAFEGVDFFCTQDDHFAYSYRLQPGVNRNSHGIKVAQLAGMPQPAIAVAQKCLASLHDRSTRNASDPSELRSLGLALLSPST